MKVLDLGDIDHAGYDDQFPMDGTTVVINRKELEYPVSGLMGEQHPAPYVKHLVDRLHHPGALRLLIANAELPGKLTSDHREAAPA